MKKVLALVLAMIMVCCSSLAFAEIPSPVPGPIPSPVPGPIPSPVPGPSSPTEGPDSPVAGANGGVILYVVPTGDVVKALIENIMAGNTFVSADAEAACAAMLETAAVNVNDVLEVDVVDSYTESMGDQICQLNVESPYTVGEKLAVIFVCYDDAAAVTAEYVVEADVVAEAKLSMDMAAQALVAIQQAANTAMIVVSAAQ